MSTVLLWSADHFGELPKMVAVRTDRHRRSSSRLREIGQNLVTGVPKSSLTILAIPTKWSEARVI